LHVKIDRIYVFSIEPEIATLYNFKTFKSYKKARQVRDSRLSLGVVFKSDFKLCLWAHELLLLGSTTKYSMIFDTLDVYGNSSLIHAYTLRQVNTAALAVKMTAKFN
jgi:hypothetical protein